MVLMEGDMVRRTTEDYCYGLTMTGSMGALKSTQTSSSTLESYR